MFKGVQNVQDVEDSFIFYQRISNQHILHLYSFKIYRMFKVYILYAQLIQTGIQNGVYIPFILAVEHIE